MLVTTIFFLFHNIFSLFVDKCQHFSQMVLYAHRRRDVLCYHPWRAGGVPHSLSGAYLQDYASYGYETSWVDRSHQGGVQCTGTITLACLIYCPLFIFILEFCTEHISKTILAMVMKFCWWIDLINGECRAQEP